MKLLDHTAEDPYSNIALDEALLESAESGILSNEVLRLWEPKTSFVVIGRSSVVAEEVDIEFCNLHQIPIIRRASGGAAIVTGPGCLMYAVVLSLNRRPGLQMLDQAHQFVLEKNSKAVANVGSPLSIRGTSDLAIDNRKVSGNSMRRKRDWILYHGTLLYDFRMDLIQSCLKTAPRQPRYRNKRDHHEFVSQIDSSSQALRDALAIEWKADSPLINFDYSLMNQLVNERYSKDGWNFRR